MEVPRTDGTGDVHEPRAWDCQGVREAPGVQAEVKAKGMCVTICIRCCDPRRMGLRVDAGLSPGFIRFYS